MWGKKNEKELIEVFKDLIRLDTTNPPGNEIKVIEYIKAILDRESIENIIISKDINRPNIVAKIRGGGKKPVMLISHVDVVKPVGEWLYDPFGAVEENGVIYGRGALDTKDLTAMELIALLMIKRSGKDLNRDIIFIATADEENGSGYGMQYIKENYPQYLPQSYVINEGGGFTLENSGKKFRTCASGEKGLCEVKIFIPGIKSDIKYEHNNHFICRLSKIIEKLSEYKSETIISNVAEKFLDALGTKEINDATLRNLWEYSTKNCLVINKFEIARNPDNMWDEAEINISFKFIYGTTKADIEKLFGKLLNDMNVEWSIEKFQEGYECDLSNELVEILMEKSNLYDEGTIMLPMIALGNTDGRYIRSNVFGYSPLLDDIPFSEVLKKVHLNNECITVNSLIYGCRVIYETLKKIAYQ